MSLVVCGNEKGICGHKPVAAFSWDVSGKFRQAAKPGVVF